MGLQLAEPGFHTRCYVEWGKHPQEVIAAGQRAGYLAPAPVWDDVTTFDGKPWRGAIDTVLAGYPCQPFSAAGKRQGADDERHLWPDVARIVGEVRPRWVFLENVAGHVSLGLDTVLRDLAGLGYTAACGLFSSRETGNSQVRKRIFIVASRDGRGQQPREIPTLSSDGGGADVASADIVGWNEGEHKNQIQERRVATARTSSGSRPRLSPPGPADLDGWRACLGDAPELAPAMALAEVAALWSSGETACGIDGAPAPESAICRMADALAARSRALHLLGNGVDPLAAGHAWRTLALAHGLGPADMG